MDGDSPESSFSQHARSLGWRTRSASPHDNIQRGLPNKITNASERKQGESRRTTIKKLQEEERHASIGAAQAPTTDITALMDNYFFFNAAHAAAATRALGTGGLLHGNNHTVTDYKNNGTNDIDLFGDNGELESRFVRTLEWVGQASKAISPSSSLSRESIGSRSLKVPGNSTATLLATNNLDIVSIGNNDLSKANEIGSSANFKDAKNNQSVSREMVAEPIRQRMDGPTLRDDFENASFRLPPNAILRGDVLATSFRAPAKPKYGADSLVTGAHNFAYGELGIPAVKRPSAMEGPSATCKLPCQSCGNGPPKKGDTLHNQDHVYHGYIDANKLFNKPNYAMAHYDRNDRLARSAYHHSSQRKPHPSEVDNLPRVQKLTNISKSKDAQQQQEKVMKVTEKPIKDKASPAAKVQQWFSKLIGKSSKEENAKSSKGSTKAIPSKTNNEGQAANKLPLDTDYELVIHGATMQDVLTNKPIVVNQNQTAPKPKLEEAQLQLRRQPPLAVPAIPKSQTLSADLRATAGAHFPPSKTAQPASNTAHTDESRVPTRRFADDAHAQRFGYGSKSERWAPLHLRQDQRRLAKDYYQHDKQILMQAPTQNNSSKSARSSPIRRGQWQPSNMNPVMATSELTVSKKLDTSIPHNQEKLNQKQRIDELAERDLVISKGAQYIQRQIDAKLYAKEANVMNDRQELSSIKGGQHNSRAFVSSYASQSERFYQRNCTPRDYEAGRRSIDTRVFSDDLSANKSMRTIKGDAIKGNELIASLPPPSDEDRDIEVLNDFLIQKKSNLHLCSYDSRIHFVLSNSSLSSMIAALCYAWTLHHSKTNQMDGWERVPVMTITRNYMWNYKQLAWLFEQAGLDTKALIFINEVDLDAIADTVGEYRISTIGQEIIRPRGEVASYCTLVAESFFKDVEGALQAKCIRILLLAGLLMDTDNLDSNSVELDIKVVLFFLLNDMPIKQGHESKDFHKIMCENYGDQVLSGATMFSRDMPPYASEKLFKIKDKRTLACDDPNKQDAQSYINLQSTSSTDYYATDFFSEESLSVARSKSSKSYTSLSTISIDQGKSRSSSTSPTKKSI
ncbi:hypothetical protein GOP47_0012127 [Adiantum capillus-veneris]|uniref:Uncharacterized protein n=1 Tax=Adiantum capillus-veneris TaxID=13818 RepID=A0A9D4UQC8_ADICA|nr:hypothetical protein GOP47_0012127 [Adiantum capillus-veneris]